MKGNKYVSIVHRNNPFTSMSPTFDKPETLSLENNMTEHLLLKGKRKQ